ncbi:hypothetical protein BX666DRAFT_1985692 [Dichotomocladium elegans]|nr:hypothetical protein BX666DRAFT_1985692 [Dichotomocladium elegans]
MSITTTRTAADVDSLNEWVKKIQFENRVDLSLQAPSGGESIKIEVDSIPNNMQTNIKKPHSLSQDPYLSAIVSGPATNATSATSIQGGCTGAPNCTCYKCQRQRRRAAGGGGGGSSSVKNHVVAPHPSARADTAPPIPSTTAPIPTAATPSSKPFPQQPQPNTAPMRQRSMPATDVRSIPVAAKKSNSICQRKRPTVKAYDKHLPPPTYSSSDSIYGIGVSNSSQTDMVECNKNDYQSNTQYNDDYQISWKDDATGDDLLNSLKTFQDIFSVQPEENQGLSDLIETKAQELKLQKIKQKQEQLAKKDDQATPRKRATDCYTLSTRQGPPHRALTLYHTMKMKSTAQRMEAYDVAFTHCIKSNSGLAGWIQKETKRGPPAVLSSYTPRQRKPAKRSLLQPFMPGRKNKGGEDLFTKVAPEGGLRRSFSTSSASLTSSPVSFSPQLPTTTTITAIVETTTPTDVLSAAHALLPNQSPKGLVSRTNNTNGAQSYDHVDTPSRPIPHKSYTEVK